MPVVPHTDGIKIGAKINIQKSETIVRNWRKKFREITPGAIYILRYVRNVLFPHSPRASVKDTPAPANLSEIHKSQR